MKIRFLLFALHAYMLINSAVAQLRVPGHQSTRSNKSNGLAATDRWQVSFTSAGAFSLRTGEGGLFRGNGWGGDLQANWMPGAAGIGLVGGFAAAGFDQSAINSFFTQRGIPFGSPVVTSNPLQAYLLAGPSFQIGRPVQLNVGLQGGLFLNSAGSLVIQRPGALVPFYRFEGDGSGVRPGWSGHLALAYPLNHNTALQLGVRLLQTGTPIRLFDPAQGIDLPRSETRRTGILTTGISLVKDLGSTPKSAGNNRGYVVGKGGVARLSSTGGSNRGYVVGKGGVARRSNKRAVDDGGSGTGLPATEKLLPPSNAVAIKTKATGAEPVRTATPGCGPVTTKTTYPDGRVQEQTFACAEDAAAYERATSTRQTQQSSFGTRVGSAAPPQDSAAGTWAVAGQLRFRSGNQNIVTNQSIHNSDSVRGPASASYASTGMAPPAGGPTLTLFAREAGSGRASGQRTFQPVFNEQTGTSCTTCPVAVPGKPIQGVTVKGGRNQGSDSIRSSRTSGKKTGGDCAEGNAIAGVTLYLRDGASGVIIARTETDACGNFFFAGITTHNLKIEIDGLIQRTKTYVFDVNANADVGGELVAGIEMIELAVEKIERDRNQRQVSSGNSGQQAAVITLPLYFSSDPDAELEAGNQSSNGPEARPGNPIRGIIVKGGRNPGGDIQTLNRVTNAHGEFLWKDVVPGSYRLLAEYKIKINHTITDPVLNLIR